MSSLENLKNALLTVTTNVGHFQAFKQANQYIVWGEDGENSSHADNRTSLRKITGTVDYFTKKQDDPYVEAIQIALSKVDIPNKLNSVQYEEETGYIHYEFVWVVLV
ncbi:MAG TPA: hypothetical protein DEP42_04935 [Ruminococcaceae bacterium]|nr:hypothetical protein [Oscillospiraceae bacterium]